MSLPVPVPGLVIRYAYLWSHEARAGREDGGKDRPSAVLLTTELKSGDTVVLALPITHTPPSDPRLAVEVPSAVKAALRLDVDRSWIILSESNRFVWPGPDLRALPNDPESFAYGMLPKALYERVRRDWLAAFDAGKVTQVARSD